MAAGLLAVDFGFAGGSGADDPALEGAVLAADLAATLFFAGFVAAVGAFPVTAGFTRAAGAAFFAGGFTADAGLPATVDLRLPALRVFFAVASAAGGIARLRLAFAGFAFTALSEGAALDF